MLGQRCRWWNNITSLLVERLLFPGFLATTNTWPDQSESTRVNACVSGTVMPRNTRRFQNELVILKYIDVCITLLALL